MLTVVPYLYLARIFHLASLANSIGLPYHLFLLPPLSICLLYSFSCLFAKIKPASPLYYNLLGMEWNGFLRNIPYVLLFESSMRMNEWPRRNVYSIPFSLHFS